MFGPVFNDIYQIDVTSGTASLIKERVQYSYGPSSSGKYLLYMVGDHYWTYDLKSGKHTNITEGVPTSFVNVDDDHTVDQKPPFRFAGWTEDDGSVLIYDKYDIWTVPAPRTRPTAQTTRSATVASGSTRRKSTSTHRHPCT
jgi:hypothetical protein